MLDHPIEGLMKTTMDNLKEMIDVNTIVGDAVETKDGTVIVPISRVGIGFASGGSEFPTNIVPKAEDEKKLPFGGGSGAGISVQPVAFLVVGQGQVKLLPVNQENSIERILEGMPEIINEAVQVFKKNKNGQGNQSNQNQYNQSVNTCPTSSTDTTDTTSTSYNPS